MTSLLPGMGPTISKSEEISALTNDDVMVTVTERASSKAKELLASKGFPDAYLRVFVVGGGCSGFQYGMSFDLSNSSRCHYIFSIMNAP